MAHNAGSDVGVFIGSPVVVLKHLKHSDSISTRATYFISLDFSDVFLEIRTWFSSILVLSLENDMTLNPQSSTGKI